MGGCLLAPLVMGRNGQIEVLDSYGLGIGVLSTFVYCSAEGLGRRRTSGSRSAGDEFRLR